MSEPLGDDPAGIDEPIEVDEPGAVNEPEVLSEPATVCEQTEAVSAQHVANEVVAAPPIVVVGVPVYLDTHSSQSTIAGDHALSRTLQENEDAAFAVRLQGEEVRRREADLRREQRAMMNTAAWHADRIYYGDSVMYRPAYGGYGRRVYRSTPLYVGTPSPPTTVPRDVGSSAEVP